MSSIPTIAAIRFGYGLSPLMAPPSDAAALMAGLSAPDQIARDYPVVPSDQIYALADQSAKLDKAIHGGDQSAVAARQQTKMQMRADTDQGFLALMQRAIRSPDGFRERLQNFWSGHFTVVAKNARLGALPTAFAEEAIRPNMAGPFSTMLRAVVTHPAMLLYLDQTSSIGPQSPVGERTHRGLNENLGRELMELHTLGVGAGYSQTDVRQMAYLLTGLNYTVKKGFTFNPRMAQPGAETVLGVRYGGAGEAKLDDIYKALDDISVRPETAHHICTKLATHFVADTPDPALVDAMTAAYSASGGMLAKVYQTMLDHPAAWAPLGAKVKQPFDFMASALRALAPAPEQLSGLDTKLVNRLLLQQLTLMGQRFQHAGGPNGWPEDAAAWLSPQMLAARIQWAMSVPVRLMPDLPDPRSFVQTTLGDAASAATLTAARAAESQREGVGLILASNDFNRR